MRLNKIVVFAIYLFLFSSFSQALTPDEFSERIDNLLSIYGTYQIAPTLSNEIISPTPTITSAILVLTNRMKIEYRDAYNAKEAQNTKVQNSNYNALMADFATLQSNIDLDLGPLKLLVMQEFGYAALPTIAIQRKEPGKAPEATVIIREGSPTPNIGLIPTIPPSQLRGRKNFIYALGDIFWEYKLLIGVFFGGILILYALYSRKEEQTALEYSGD